MQNLFTGDKLSTERIICTPSPFARENLLYLQEIGTLHARKGHMSSRKGLHSYLLFYVESGNGTVTYNGMTYSLKAGDCCFLNCIHLYSHKSSEQKWTLRWIHFYGPAMDQIYENYMDHGGKCCFTPRESGKYRHLWARLNEIASSDFFVKEMAVMEVLSALLTRLMQDGTGTYAVENEPGKRRDVRQIRAYLGEHFSENILLDDLANRFFINKYYLTHIFKEQYGVTINGYLVQLRMTRAKELLRFSGYTMDEVGTACGYADTNYFIRCFKKTEGVTPGEYRRAWLAGTN